MREKVLVSSLLSFFVLFISFSGVLGVNVSINKYPEEIGNDEFEVTVLIEGADKGKII